MGEILTKADKRKMAEELRLSVLRMREDIKRDDITPAERKKLSMQIEKLIADYGFDD